MRIDQLHQRILRCRACAALLRGRHVDPLNKSEPLRVRPVVSPSARAPVVLVCQAPGIEEYRARRPFRGRAGREVRELFEGLGVAAPDFDRVVYQTAASRCFAGRRVIVKDGKLTERDIAPTAEETHNCAPFLAEEIRLVRPRVLVLLGIKAIEAYELMRGRRRKAGLRAYVGRAERWRGAAVVFLPHASGTSRWLNRKERRNRSLNAEARRLLGAELRRAGVARPRMEARG